jgi:hypothetical protein
MVIAETQSPGSIQGLPNLYRAMLIVSLLVLILLPVAMLNAGAWLESRGKGIEGNLAALNAEVAALGGVVTADNRAMAALEGQVTAIARTQQLLDKDVDPNTIWGPDSRWSDMAKARALELWNRREALQRHVHETQMRVCEKTAEILRVQGAKEQNTYMARAITGHRFLLLTLIALGIVLTLLSIVAWQLLIQRHINALLRRWTD